MKKITLFIPCLIFAISTAYGQNQTVTGTVTDAGTGEPLPGVNIILEGTATGTSTDSEGHYELSLPSFDGRLVFSFIGYQSEQIPLNGQTTIDVALQLQALAGEEVVVVGYGTQRRENLTGSVQSIGGADLAEQPVVQTSSALMGKAPGVQLVQNSGQPGENQATIRIRGVGTLGNSNPLVLIDGVEGNIDDVPTSDIESISILKDASSAAIYGSRAANGVILITTKRGQSTEFQVRYNGRFGIQQATSQPEYVDGGTFMRLENLGATNLGKQAIWSEDYINEWEANYTSNSDEYPNTNWVEEVFSETASQTQHNLTLSGGSENVRYYGSLQYDNETSEIVNFGNKRYSIRLNTDVFVSDELSFNVDFNTVREDQKEPSIGLARITRQAYRLPPVYVAQYTNGMNGPGAFSQNPVAFANDGGLHSIEHYTIYGRLQSIYEPAKGLQFKLSYAPEFSNIFDRNMAKQWQGYDLQGNVVTTNPSQNSLSENFSRSFTNNLNFTTTYQQDLANHSFKILGGYEFIDYRNDWFDASRDDFPLQDFEQLNAGSQANQQNSGSAASFSLQSAFGRLNYGYRDKYLFEANLRYDGSSRFTEDNRWGIFPSFSLGWRISEESLMESLDFISELKLRGSWGKLGNQEIGNYPFAAVVNFGQNYLFGGSVVSGAAQLDLANPNISWEETTTTDIGLDVSLFNNRIGMTFDWFNRTTDDILLRLPIPLIIGLNAPFQNAGKVENTGWEVQIDYNDGIGSDFTYSASFNISDVDNKVTDLKDAGPFISGNSITREGDPINSIYGFEADGLFDSQEEIENHATQTGQIAPGDIKYVDQPTVDTNGDNIPDEGDGIINADDRVVIGNPFPTLNYGLNLSAQYKNFDVSALFQGVGSRDVYMQGDAIWALQNAGKVTTWQAEQYWTQENPNDDYPRLTQTTDHNNFQTSSYWVFDASYIRLRNLQVGYTIPTQWSNRISARQLRIYFVGQNLLTLFDNMPPGIDPNVPNSTVGSFFPIQKLYSIGIDINF